MLKFILNKISKFKFIQIFFYSVFICNLLTSSIMKSKEKFLNFSNKYKFSIRNKLKLYKYIF
jgi:hypothetical protein